MYFISRRQELFSRKQNAIANPPIDTYLGFPNQIEFDLKNLNLSVILNFHDVKRKSLYRRRFNLKVSEADTRGVL